MADYRPVLYHSQISPRCARVRRAIRHLEVEIDLRDILFSRRHRQELVEMIGEVRVPCLIVAGTPVCETDEIEKYLRLRYGEGFSGERRQSS
jgi:glutathione S-transferase